MRDVIYGIPESIDLSAAVGEFTTQVRVGQHDLQMAFGPVNFAAQSSADLYRGSELVAHWQAGRWPDPGFFEIMNTPIRGWRVAHRKTLIVELENGLALHLSDDSERFETMHITVHGDVWII